MALRGRPVHENGSGHSLVVNFTDVTARVEAQEALAEREAQLVDAQRLARLGEQRWFHCRARAAYEEGRPVRVLGTIQDITEQKVAEETLAHRALHDDLTGLAGAAGPTRHRGRGRRRSRGQRELAQ